MLQSTTVLYAVEMVTVRDAGQVVGRGIEKRGIERREKGRLETREGREGERVGDEGREKRKWRR